MLKRIQVVRFFRFHTQYATARIAIHLKIAVAIGFKATKPIAWTEVNASAMSTRPMIYAPTLLLTAIIKKYNCPVKEAVWNGFKNNQVLRMSL
jgi:hypothetical protein